MIFIEELPCLCATLGVFYYTLHVLKFKFYSVLSNVVLRPFNVELNKFLISLLIVLIVDCPQVHVVSFFSRSHSFCIEVV